VNWYIKLCSKNIFVSQDIKMQIEEISSEIFYKLNQFNLSKKESEFVKTIQVGLLSINIFMAKSNQQSTSSLASTGINNKEEYFINVYVTNLRWMAEFDKDDSYYRRILYDAILHEVVHNIDPKLTTRENEFRYKEKHEEIERLEYENDKNWKNEYFNSQPEFDAFSAQISDNILSFLISNPLKKDFVLDILRSNDIRKITEIIGTINAGFIVNIDEGNKRRLKQRIYNDIKHLL